MSKSADDALASMVANLKENTGKSLEQWVALARSSGLAKHGEIVAFLKTQHGLTHGYANMVVHTAMSSSSLSQDSADLVEAQYAGPKSALKPIYDELINVLTGFGPDVEISPKKAYVSVRRSKQFAIVQPSTKDRIDVGINLKGVAAAGRLEPSGSFNAMVSHRVKLTALADVDAELKSWLRRAYDGA